MDKDDKKLALITAGSAIAGIALATVVIYREEIADKINAIFSKTPTPTPTKFCAKENKDIPESEWTSARCDITPAMKFCAKEGKDIPESEWTSQRCDVTTPPMKYCEKEGRDIPESEWTDARCIVVVQSSTKIVADLSQYNIQNIVKVKVSAIDGSKVYIADALMNKVNDTTYEYVVNNSVMPVGTYKFTVYVHKQISGGQYPQISVTAFDFIQPITGGDTITLGVK